MSKVLNSLVDKDGFRLRGTEVSRIDAFSDVVFGFAVSLLVVSLQVPKTFDELRGVLMGFAPFALCFWILLAVWLRHYQFFRRFGLHDIATIRINAVLLFVILFYVYPLKFLFTLALGATHDEVFSKPTQIRQLMVLYGVGVCALNGLIALLNYQGWRHRHVLQLSRHEELLTRSYIVDACIVAGIGLLSCAVACILPPRDAGNAGWTYLLIAAHRPIHSLLLRRRLRRLHEPSHSPEAAE